MPTGTPCMPRHNTLLPSRRPPACVWAWLATCPPMHPLGPPPVSPQAEQPSPPARSLGAPTHARQPLSLRGSFHVDSWEEWGVGQVGGPLGTAYHPGPSSPTWSGQGARGHPAVAVGGPGTTVAGPAVALQPVAGGVAAGTSRCCRAGPHSRHCWRFTCSLLPGGDAAEQRSLREPP